MGGFSAQISLPHIGQTVRGSEWGGQEEEREDWGDRGSSRELWNECVCEERGREKLPEEGSFFLLEVVRWCPGCGRSLPFSLHPKSSRDSWKKRGVFLDTMSQSSAALAWRRTLILTDMLSHLGGQCLYLLPPHHGALWGPHVLTHAHYTYTHAHTPSILLGCRFLFSSELLRQDQGPLRRAGGKSGA